MTTVREAASQDQERVRRLRDFFHYRSIRFRLATLFVTIFGGTLVLFTVLMYEVFVRSGQTDFDAALFNHAVDVARAVDVDFFGDLSIQVDQLTIGSKVFPFSPGRAYVQIRNHEGVVLGRSRNLAESVLPLSKDEAQEVTSRGFVFSTIPEPVVIKGQPDSGGEFRMISYLIARPQIPRLILQVAVPTTLLNRERRGLLVFLWVNIPLTMVVALLGGLYLSRRALMPISDIIEKAARIGADRLSERLPVPPVEDELQALAQTLNALLDRLQRAFESQERFVADASHQLKTPLSILRGEIDLMRSRERSPEEIRDFLASASQEIDHLNKLVEDLLVLARVDAGHGSLSIAQVRLDEILLDEVARLDRLASARGVKIRFNVSADHASDSAGPHAFEVRGDSDLLRSLFHNLIENALKYSPDHSTVRVDLGEDASACWVTVQDEGKGIPDSERERIFDRFYRLESTRDGAPGAGLGLAIARRIAEAHRGTIEAGNAPWGGAVFRVRIKKL